MLDSLILIVFSFSLGLGIGIVIKGLQDTKYLRDIKRCYEKIVKSQEARIYRQSANITKLIDINNKLQANHNMPVQAVRIYKKGN